MKTITVDVKSRKNVQGKDWAINWLTGVGKATNEGPKSPERSRRQKATYCSNRGWSKPYISFRARIVSWAAFGSV